MKARMLFDAGHGGQDPGAIYRNVIQNLEEDDLNMAIVFAMRDVSAEWFPDWEVILVRQSPNVYLSPGQRMRICHLYSPAAFVSIHCNSSDNPEAHGSETLYRDSVDLPLAIAIQNTLVERLGTKNRGVKSDMVDLGRQLSVLSTPTTPGVLVEPGFLSNEKDRALLVQPRLIAEAVIVGLARWHGELRAPEPGGGNIV